MFNNYHCSKKEYSIVSDYMCTLTKIQTYFLYDYREEAWLLRACWQQEKLPHNLAQLLQDLWKPLAVHESHTHTHTHTHAYTLHKDNFHFSWLGTLPGLSVFLTLFFPISLFLFLTAYLTDIPGAPVVVSVS